MVKFTIFSDAHVHPFPAFSNIEDGANSRLLEILDVLDQILTISEYNDSDAILFTGDFWHIKKIDAPTIDLTTRILNKHHKDIPIIAISGNHEESKDGLYSSLKNLDGLIKILNDEVIRIKGISIYGLPYSASKPQNITYTADILLMHTGIKGALMKNDFVDYSSEILKEDLHKKAGLSIIGHLHEPQYFQKFNVLIPGAPCQHNFSDIGSERGCWLWDDGELTFIPIDGPKFIRLKPEEYNDSYKNYYIEFLTDKQLSSNQIDQLKLAKGYRIAREDKKQEINERISNISKLNIYDVVKRYSEVKNRQDTTYIGIEILRKALEKDVKVKEDHNR